MIYILLNYSETTPTFVAAFEGPEGIDFDKKLEEWKKNLLPCPRVSFSDSIVIETQEKLEYEAWKASKATSFRRLLESLGLKQVACELAYTDEIYDYEYKP